MSRRDSTIAMHVSNWNRCMESCSHSIWEFGNLDIGKIKLECRSFIIPLHQCRLACPEKEAGQVVEASWYLCTDADWLVQQKQLDRLLKLVRQPLWGQSYPHMIRMPFMDMTSQSLSKRHTFVRINASLDRRVQVLNSKDHQPSHHVGKPAVVCGTFMDRRGRIQMAT